MNGQTSKLRTAAVWAVALGLLASGLVLTAAAALALSGELKTGDQLRTLHQQAVQQREAQP